MNTTRCSETVDAMRSVDPNVLIVAPATALDWVFLEDLFRRGMLDWVDAVSVHPYRFLDPPETVTADYQRLRALIESYSSRDRVIAIVSSEWGYSSVTSDLRDVEDVQGRYLPACCS